MTTLASTTVPHHLTPKLKRPLLTFQYADDTVFVLIAKGPILRALLLVIHSFSACSDLKVNFAKSAFVPLNVPDHHLDKIQSLMGCCRQEFPLTYIRMPLTLKAPNRSDYMPLLQKLEKKLEGWRGCFLSTAGRLQVVKSVLSAIPTYFMSCFRLPKWLTERIDAIRRQFLWSKSQPGRGVHLINWKIVCLSLRCGGLGVQDLKLQNIFLLLRWWWRLFVPDRKLWRSHASSLYTTSKSQPSPLILAKKGSFFWNSIASLRTLFHGCSQFQIGSGRQISYWYDGWDGMPLSLTQDGPLLAKDISLFEARTCSHNLLPAP